MIRCFIAVALGLAGFAAPAAAQDRTAALAEDSTRWVHPGSGASFPRSIAAQRLISSQDLSSPYDGVVEYSGEGTAVESTTVYIFRAAIPDARLWFERALPIVARSIPLDIFEVGPDESFTAFGAAAPNGLQRIYTTTRQGPFRTTSIAVAQAGEWLVKFRVSSASLDRAGVAARIAALAGAIRFPSSAALSPLSAPIADCQAPAAAAQGRPAPVDEEAVAMGVAAGLSLMAQIRRPLASDGWCRDPGAPAAFGTLVRRGNGDGAWMILIGDAGKAVAALDGAELGLPDERRVIVYAATPASVRGTAIFDGMPSLIDALRAAAPVLAGSSEGIFELRVGNGAAAEAQPIVSSR